MISLKQIRQDLRDIRYYYSKQKMFDGFANSLGQNDIVERAAMYNKAMQKAPIKLSLLQIVSIQCKQRVRIVCHRIIQHKTLCAILFCLFHCVT